MPADEYYDVTFTYNLIEYLKNIPYWLIILSVKFVVQMFILSHFESTPRVVSKV